MAVEHAADMPAKGATGVPDAEAEGWDPPAGDQYLPSLYFESEDGVTEAVTAAGEADYASSVDFMDDLVDYLSERGVTLQDDETDEFVINSEAVRAIAEFFHDRPIDA